jgi:hypothetical protein
MNQYPDLYCLLQLVSKQYSNYINTSTGDHKRYTENLKAKNFTNGSRPVYEKLNPRIVQANKVNVSVSNSMVSNSYLN